MMKNHFQMQNDDFVREGVERMLKVDFDETNPEHLERFDWLKNGFANLSELCGGKTVRMSKE